MAWLRSLRPRLKKLATKATFIECLRNGTHDCRLTSASLATELEDSLTSEVCCPPRDSFKQLAPSAQQTSCQFAFSRQVMRSSFRCLESGKVCLVVQSFLKVCIFYRSRTYELSSALHCSSSSRSQSFAFSLALPARMSHFASNFSRSFEFHGAQRSLVKPDLS